MAPTSRSSTSLARSWAPNRRFYFFIVVTALLVVLNALMLYRVAWDHSASTTDAAGVMKVRARPADRVAAAAGGAARSRAGSAGCCAGAGRQQSRAQRNPTGRSHTVQYTGADLTIWTILRELSETPVRARPRGGSRVPRGRRINRCPARARVWWGRRRRALVRPARVADRVARVAAHVERDQQLARARRRQDHHVW